MAKKELKPGEYQKPGMGYTVTLVVCVAIIVYAVYVSKQRSQRGFDEADLLAQRRAEQEGGGAAGALGADEFPPELEDPNFSAQLMRIQKRLHGGIEHCLEGWVGYPQEARIRIRTDALGQIESLAVEGAPEGAEQCLLLVLSKGQFPMKSDAVSLLRLDLSGADMEEAGNAVEDIPEESPHAPKYKPLAP